MSTKKILVVYYSRTGKTERVAKDVASKLNADIEKIIDRKNRGGFWGYLFGGRDATRKFTTEIGALAKDPGNYDLVVIGTPLWAWGMTPAVRTYIGQTKGKLKDIALFGTSGSSSLDKTIASMEELAGKKALASVGFNARELGNEKTYSEKISAFVKAIE